MPRSKNHIVFSIFRIGLICLLVHAAPCTAGSARIQRHLVIYGGLSRADLPTVASNADIVIVNNVAREHLVRLKQINPRLLVFQYHHAPGFHRHYPGWEQVSAREDWFVHDRRTGERLVEKKYGWLLMNIADESWRQHLAARIADSTDDIFDGVFLDDVWNRFSNKFRCETSKSAARPPKTIVENWAAHMQQMIAEIRLRYPKRLFINGAHEEYIRAVDGCMEENFIHPNWKPETDLPDPSAYWRMLQKMEKMKGYGKTLLIQSGTSGADPAAVRRIFEFCLASYLLVEGADTSFGFQRAPTYRYLGPLYPEDVHPDIGEPTGPFRIVEEPRYPPNLAANGSFEQGWRHWQVLQGRPRIESRMPAGQSAMAFKSRPSGSDKIAGVLIPVAENTRYRLAAACKTKNNRAGGRRYEKLGIQGRFYSADRKKLSGAYDLQFEEGTHDWLPYETTFVSPPGAGFFRLRIGFIGDGTGMGWVSRVYFGPAEDAPMVVGRSFTRAQVLVNGGTAEKTITAEDADAQTERTFALRPGGAAVIPFAAAGSNAPRPRR